ncbi:MAG: hypothetical protein Q9220_002457 [cf. Caloplaca sp. 1 TL-2023]
MPRATSPANGPIISPADPTYRTASPSHTREIDSQQYQGQEGLDTTNADSVNHEDDHDLASPVLTSLPSMPASPQQGPKHGREQSRSLFANYKATRSSNKVHKLEATIRQVSEDTPRDSNRSGERSLYSLQKGSGSTPDLSLSTLNTSSIEAPGTDQDKPGTVQRPVGPSILSDTALVTTSTDPKHAGKIRPRFTHLLTRTRSIRTEEGGGRRSKPVTPIQTTLEEDLGRFDGNEENGGLKTAPLEMDNSRTFRDLMGSAIRNKSADRQPINKQSSSSSMRGRPGGDNRGLAPPASNSFRDGTGSKLFANIKNTSSKATDGLGKAGKGLFHKMGRSGSNNTKEESGDGQYRTSVINLPLIEQTRRTRIARRLEDSRDKTEFWMPALPWRCIDYLNFRGCEEEGLYRVPGSGTKIKHYQERFDRELDINLFDEAELYDINIIGSLFKAWLRDLPSEILPKATQAKIATAHPNVSQVPQMLRDELSNLPPWNYYLLFAITCHLSLLHAYHEKNKMSYSNLCICFQPCIGIDSYCFQFLVCDWRNCWQGCHTEKEYLEQEYRILDGIQTGDYRFSTSDDDGSTLVPEESAAPSSGSNSRAHMFSRSRDKMPPPPTLNVSHPDQNIHSSNHGRSEAQLPELQPMMPLSPMAWETRAQADPPSTGAS